jgi:hypothetical protein
MVNAAFQEQSGDHAAQPEAADQGMVRPALEWHMPTDALAAWGASEGPR